LPTFLKATKEVIPGIKRRILGTKKKKFLLISLGVFPFGF